MGIGKGWTLGRRFAVAAATLAAGAIVPASASAVTTTYHPNQESRDFASSAGNWTNSAVYEGLGCVPAVLCPSIDNSFQASGGADGGSDGVLRVGLDGLAATLLATSTGVWESPNFTYSGAGGAVPDTLAFSLASQSNIGGLLALPGNSVKFSVEAVDVTSPAGSVTIVDSVDAVTATSWSPAAVAVPRNALTLGHTYRLRISTAYETVVGLIVDATVDYDDVALVADGPGAGNKASGGGLVGKSAVLKGSKLRVKVKCGRAVQGKCKMKLVGLWKKAGPRVTKLKKARVGSGKKKKVALKVKRNALAALQTRSKIWVAIKVNANGQKTLKVKKLKLIKRG